MMTRHGVQVVDRHTGVIFLDYSVVVLRFILNHYTQHSFYGEEAYHSAQNDRNESKGLVG